MKHRLKILLLIFVLTQISVHAQKIGFEEIDSSKVRPWLPKLTNEYQMVYHFGESEMESDFVLLICFGKYYAQIKSGQFSDDGKSYIWNFENLTNVRIEGNKFYSDKTNGEFVQYDNGKETLNGLKVYKPWSGITENNEFEIGVQSYPVTKFYFGKFPQASLNFLNEDELKQISKNDLKIMRNEIYARYGYEFKAGSEMDLYFKKQSWYIKQHENVGKFLTDLEKKNIKLIQNIENK